MVFPPAVDADNSYSNGSVEARPRGAPLQYRKRQGRACRGFCGVYNEFSSIDFFHNGFSPIRALTQSEIDAQVPASCHFDAAMLDLFTLQCKSSSILLSRLSQKPGTPFEDLGGEPGSLLETIVTLEQVSLGTEGKQLPRREPIPENRRVCRERPVAP